MRSTSNPRSEPQRTPAPRLRRALVAALVFASLSATYACSLLVENQTEQCQSDSDCAKFTGTSCDLGQHVCVGKGSSTSSSGTTTSSSGAGGGSCVGDAGCWSCAATTNTELLNACTDATCKPFDNKARCTHLGPDGGLPAVP